MKGATSVLVMVILALLALAVLIFLAFKGQDVISELLENIGVSY